MKQQPKPVYAFREDDMIVLSSAHPIWCQGEGEWGIGYAGIFLGELLPFFFTQRYGYVLDDPRDLLSFDKDGRYVDGWTYVKDDK